MAMYYYASKISAVACGARCKHNNTGQKQRNYKDRYRERGKSLDNDDDDDDDDKMMTKFEKSCIVNRSQTISGSSNEPPEYPCNDAPIKSDLLDASLGPNGIMYKNGNIVSGPLDTLIDLVMPSNLNEIDRDFIFSFLLSSRFFIRPHEILGRLLSSIPESESLDRLVEVLKFWTKTFPYDFRDERIMGHVKHIVAKCADTGLEDEVSELLRALLNRLTNLERHEEELRACQSSNEKVDQVESIRWPTASQLAQLLCRIERKLAKHVGPEEFVQCNANVLHSRSQKSQHHEQQEKTSSNNALDPKKTCNFESYLEWSSRLKLLVANEILQCTGIRDRSKIVEMWSGAAQYCLLVGNYNSATAILESLDTPPIARLHLTWSKLSTTCQQLDCMQRHAEGCGDLWNKQTITTNCSGTTPSANNTIERRKTATTTTNSKTKPPSSDWVVIPIFSDIVRLALTAREDCSTILPNGHVNIAAFDRLAAIVGAFTRHMNEVNTTLPDVGEYESLCRHMQSCSLISESELMLASFDCEEPTATEKKEYGVA